MIQLTQQERDKLAAWLDQEVKSNAPLVEQMVVMKMQEPIIQKMKTETMACAIVSKMLKSIETVTIG